MQTTRVFFAPIENKEIGRTIDQLINEELEKNPNLRLTNVVVIESTETFCTLLCVFEKDNENNENDENDNTKEDK